MQDDYVRLVSYVLAVSLGLLENGLRQSLEREVVLVLSPLVSLQSNALYRLQSWRKRSFHQGGSPTVFKPDFANRLPYLTDAVNGSWFVPNSHGFVLG